MWSATRDTPGLDINETLHPGRGARKKVFYRYQGYRSLRSLNLWLPSSHRSAVHLLGGAQKLQDSGL